MINKDWRKINKQHPIYKGYKGNPLSNDADPNVRVFKRGVKEIEEILPDCKFGPAGYGTSKIQGTIVKPMGLDQRIMMTNKACYATPEKEDFGQHTTPELGGDVDQYQKLLMEQYGFDPIEPDRLVELRRLLHNTSTKVENSSQYVNPDFLGDPQWHHVDTIDDIDQFFKRDKPTEKRHVPIDDLQISSKPRIKVIAEQFTKLKSNNLEVRKLEEKIVCVEYDVYNTNDASKFPIQTMRAFFTIKTTCDKCDGEKMFTEIPMNVKNELDVREEDLSNKTEKEIEIIDENIKENKPYLDDLKRVLGKKRAINRKKMNTSLDLMSLYEMAYRECPPLDYDFSNTNLLSKAELAEMKHMILNNCETGGHGICRKTLKKPNENIDAKSDSVYDIWKGVENNVH